jgi:Uma2 family endonuclease
MIRRSETPILPDWPAPPAGPITFEEFLEWCDGEVRAEWVDGEVLLMSPSSDDHQLLSGFVYRLLAAFVEAYDLGLVFYAPMLMRLSARPSGREPDLLYLARDHLDRLRRTYIDGPADLAVEIVSPESDERDRVTKLAEYELARVPEYWLLDVLRHTATFYQLGADGRYRPGEIGADGIYRSAVLSSFWLRVEWLWQKPLPRVAGILR